VRFSRKRQSLTDVCQSFFQGLGENTCSLQTCIEKHCIRPLNSPYYVEACYELRSSSSCHIQQGSTELA